MGNINIEICDVWYYNWVILIYMNVYLVFWMHALCDLVPWSLFK